jgi:Na+-driven multidrug efflux pump
VPILTGIPAAAQPYFWPILGIVIVLMGFVALVSFNNPGARAAVKEHLLWIVVAAVLIFGGTAMVTSFLRGAGAS